MGSLMDTGEAILGLSQSEKIKIGLISLAQSLDVLDSLPVEEKRGAERMMKVFLAATINEVRLAGTLVPQEGWKELDTLLERALVMIESGVAQEAMIHISRALSLATNISQRAMTSLGDRGLLSLR